ncbi:NUDIX domain-containing protein [Planctomycetota bacterium]
MPTAATDWSQFRYCPKCGSGAITCRGKKLTCQACSLVFYINPTLSVVAVITDTQGRILVATRGQDPAKGAWDLPGGFMDPGENAEQALAREIKEELGVNLTIKQYLGTAPNVYLYKGITYNTVDIAFLCQIDTPETIQPDDDITDASFVQVNETNIDRFAFPSIRHFAQMFMS